MIRGVLTLVTLVSTVFLPSDNPHHFLSPLSGDLIAVEAKQEEKILAQRSLDLATRHGDPQVNQVFVDNILLALHCLKGDRGNRGVDWEMIRQPFEMSFFLQPGEIFAFHDNVLPEFDRPAVTMNSRFLAQEGYRSVGGLAGNGVCHLASLINWASSKALRQDSGQASPKILSEYLGGQEGIEVTSLVKHDFAIIPGVPRAYGTSIRSQQKNQNLYLKNTFDFPVEFRFRVDERFIKLFVLNSSTIRGVQAQPGHLGGVLTSGAEDDF